jgi:hypothetical protein
MILSGWLLVAVMPAQQVAEQPELVGWMLLVGFTASTLIAVAMDRRFGPPGLGPLWSPPSVWMYGPALLAGLGVTILASELGNVIMSLSPQITPAGVENVLEGVPRWQLAVLGCLVAPVGLGVVLFGIVQRALAGTYRPQTAFLWTVVMGSLVLPAAPHQAAMIIALPVWLYRHTRALPLAVVGLLPFAQGVAMELYDIGPGITGFDLLDPNKVVFQPVWFDLLGAALLAAGLAPLIRAFEGPIEPKAPAEPAP